jgi:hypothetical protein
MTFEIRKATKFASKLRLALIGISGSGKTYSALEIAKTLGKRICLIDTEFGSASKYADKFEFDTLPLETFSPLTYVEALEYVDKQGYDVVIVDSLSHAWMGKDGALEQVDKAAKRSQSANTFAAWRDVTPMHNKLVDSLLRVKAHLIVTMRAKSEYVMEEYEYNGKKKTKPVKIGLAPIQRDGLEYEFDVVGDMDIENNYIISKTRCSELHQAVINKPGKQFALTLINWLDGAPAPARVEPQPEKSSTTVNGNGQMHNAVQNEQEMKPEGKRDFYAEVSKLNSIEELKTWFLAVPVAQRQKGSEAFGAKESRKMELENPKAQVTTTTMDAPTQTEPAPESQEALQVEILDNFTKIKATTREESLAKLDAKIESVQDIQVREQLIKKYNSRLTEVGSNYTPSILPF